MLKQVVVVVSLLLVPNIKGGVYTKLQKRSRIEGLAKLSLCVCLNISDSINSKKSAHIQRISAHEFSVAHYTGKITYDARDLADKNRDFLPPEMVSHSGILKIHNSTIYNIIEQ